MTSDAVAAGSGVDTAVLRKEWSHDSAGRFEKGTSYDASSGGNVVNQIQRTYNGFGQVLIEYQEHVAAVNTSTSPKTQYAYVDGTNNTARLTKMTYPNSRELNYTYGSSGSVNDLISRLAAMQEGSPAKNLEAYDYLGLDTIVQMRRPMGTGTDEMGLSYVKLSGEGVDTLEGGDQYTGLDQFGRVKEQRWRQIVGSGTTATDDFKYGYDRNSNPLYRDNVMMDSLSGASEFDELFHANDDNSGAPEGYDGLNRLPEFRRGELSDANGDGVLDKVTTAARSQVWVLDAVGNWDSLNSDGAGAKSRTHNKQNEITVITSSTNPTYDSNGNTTKDSSGNLFTYDAWNRLVYEKKNPSTTFETFSYDAINRRIRQVRDTTLELPSGPELDFYYTVNWQMIEDKSDGTLKNQYVWSAKYIDALVLRDRDAGANGDLGISGSGLDERLFVQHDANFNTTAVIDTTGAVQERYLYDPYGSPTYKTSTWGTRSSSSHTWLYMHQGGRYDAVGNLYHFRNRDHSPTLGRWMQNDPLGYVDGMNRYEYEMGGPGDGLDPEGLRTHSGSLGLGATAHGPRGKVIGKDDGSDDLGKVKLPTGIYERYPGTGRDIQNPAEILHEILVPPKLIVIGNLGGAGGLAVVAVVNDALQPPPPNPQPIRGGGGGQQRPDAGGAVP